MVIGRPQPDFPKLECKVCGIVKKQADKNDDITLDKDDNYATGTWFCSNGHANRI
jgi:hypothetical protein